MPKTEEELFNERIERSMSQRLHLLGFQKQLNNYSFNVEGTTGNSYSVKVSEKNYVFMH